MISPVAPIWKNSIHIPTTIWISYFISFPVFMTYGTFCYIIKLTSFNINYLYQKAAVAHIAYNAKWKVLLKVNMALYKTLKKILRPHFIWEDYGAA